MMIVIITLLVAPILLMGAIPLGPVLAVLGLWFIGSGIQAIWEDHDHKDIIVLNIILYGVPGIVLLAGAIAAGNRGLLELLF